MPRTRTSSAIELLVPLDRGDPRSLHRQLEQELREGVRSGRLAAESRLPSSRTLATQLGVSRGIVVEAYEQLIAEGYLASRPGGATHVARAATPAATRRSPTMPPQVELDFRPGRPDLGEFPRATWLRSVRRALQDAPSERFGYLDGRGMPELRGALADYLNRVRGTDADPDDIVVCTGFAQGLQLVASVLRGTGARRYALEDPSQADAWSDLVGMGLDVVGIPVDEAGLRVDLLDAAGVDAVVVTAAHQYPTGGVLTPERRAALVAWTGRTGGLVIEDDYDAEFRYDREPIGAIQGLCPERVVYAGSASKILAPGLRLGWLVLPTRLAAAVGAAKRRADGGSPALDQLAFADFLARGELDHHLRRLRPIYRARRDALLTALDRHLPDLRPVGASAGLHVLAWLPPDLDQALIVAAADRDGIAIMGIGPPKADPTGPGAIIFGYGSVGEGSMDRGVRRLAEAMERTRTRPLAVQA